MNIKVYMRISIFILALCIASLFQGCAKVKYLEVETPPGQVPPADEPSIGSVEDNPELNRPQTPGQSIESDIQETRECRRLRFQEAYVDHGSPRIAILFNRELSANVQEWLAQDRLLITGEYNETKDSGSDSESTKGDFTVEGKRQIYVGDSEERRLTSVAEQRIWAFENGVIQPMLTANVNIVDRATIIRLVAADNESSDKAISSKSTEMTALMKYADLYAELLVSRLPAVGKHKYGYDFKAVVKDIQSGKILAIATSEEWGGRQDRYNDKDITATSHGYEIGKEISWGEAGERLSYEIMDALTKTWEY